MQRVSTRSGLFVINHGQGSRGIFPWPTPIPSAAFCRQVAPKGFEDFYYPNTTKSGLSCVSNCSANTASAIDCNEGQCHLTLSGPQCL